VLRVVLFYGGADQRRARRRRRATQGCCLFKRGAPSRHLLHAEEDVTSSAFISVWKPPPLTGGGFLLCSGRNYVALIFPFLDILLSFPLFSLNSSVSPFSQCAIDFLHTHNYTHTHTHTHTIQSTTQWSLMGQWVWWEWASPSDGLYKTINISPYGRRCRSNFTEHQVTLSNCFVRSTLKYIMSYILPI